jgi:uncharacterized membrane protein
MDSLANVLMSIAALVVLVVGAPRAGREVAAARGWEKLIALGSLFVAVSLAAFAPEHFHGPAFVQNMVPSYMPFRLFWAYLVGCAIFAAAVSLSVGKLERWSSTLLGVMFTLFVCMIYLPSAIGHADNRLAWSILLRDSSFAAGSWALAGLHWRAAAPQPSKWMVFVGRIIIATAAIFYGVQHWLHPEIAPGVPLTLKTPAWVPFPSLWAYLTGAVLLAGGVGLAVNKHARMAAAAIGAVMTALVLFLYLPNLFIALGKPAAAVNEGLNYVYDTLLYAGAALVLASALPHESRLMDRPRAS